MGEWFIVYGKVVWLWRWGFEDSGNYEAGTARYFTMLAFRMNTALPGGRGKELLHRARYQVLGVSSMISGTYRAVIRWQSQFRIPTP